MCFVFFGFSLMEYFTQTLASDLKIQTFANIKAELWIKKLFGSSSFRRFNNLAPNNGYLFHRDKKSKFSFYAKAQCLICINEVISQQFLDRLVPPPAGTQIGFFVFQVALLRLPIADCVLPYTRL